MMRKIRTISIVLCSVGLLLDCVNVVMQLYLGNTALAGLWFIAGVFMLFILVMQVFVFK